MEFFCPFKWPSKKRVCLGTPYKVDSFHPTYIPGTRLGDRFDGGTNGDGGELAGKSQRTELNLLREKWYSKGEGTKNEILKGK